MGLISLRVASHTQAYHFHEQSIQSLAKRDD